MKFQANLTKKIYQNRRNLRADIAYKASSFSPTHKLILNRQGVQSSVLNILHKFPIKIITLNLILFRY
jgi:hypothetical protein